MIDWNRKLTRAINASEINGVKQALEKGADVNTGGGTCLIGAANSKNIEIVKLLIENGISLNYLNNAIGWARKWECFDIVDYLTNHGRKQKLKIIENC
jgi:ankyrin repeat protein